MCWWHHDCPRQMVYIVFLTCMATMVGAYCFLEPRWTRLVPCQKVAGPAWQCLRGMVHVSLHLLHESDGACHISRDRRRWSKPLGQVCHFMVCVVTMFSKYIEIPWSIRFCTCGCACGGGGMGAGGVIMIGSSTRCLAHALHMYSNCYTSRL